MANQDLGSMEEAPSADLLREVIEDARELVKLEVSLARDEVTHEFHAAVQSAIAFGVAGACAILVVAMLSVAIILASGALWVAFLFAFAFLAVSAVAAAVGYSRLPKKPLPTTRARLQNDVEQLKEHIA